MSHCEKYKMLISALLDEEITEAERSDLMNHLEQCADCAAFLSDQLAIKEALHGLTAQVPAGFSEHVMARVRETAQDHSEKAKKVLSFPRIYRWVSLAACCAVVTFGAVALGSLPRSMEATADSAAYGIELNENTAAPQTYMDGLTLDTDSAAEDYGTADTARSGTPEIPAASEPCAEDDNCEPSFTGERATLLAASGATVQQWVEDTLGKEWISGWSYYLTAEEYAQLRGLLLDAGESFTEVTGTGEIEFYLLQAE